MTTDTAENVSTPGHSSAESEDLKEEVTSNGNLNSEDPVEKPEWQDLLGSGSIMKKIIKEGEADTRPQRLQKCTLNYKLSLEDDTVIEEQQKFGIQLGDCEVVQGLDVALGMMNVGERCILKIAPRLAFGSVGLDTRISPNSSVFYDIELEAVGPEVEPEDLSVVERKREGNKKRERGNWWYGRGENTIAIQCYRRALDFLDEVEGGTTNMSETENEEVSDSTLQELLEDRISVYNNMAATQIKLELYDAALNSLQTVLRCQPNNVKALFRKAKIHKEKHDLNAALKCLKKGYGVAPDNLDVQKEIAAITKLIQKQKVTERELAKRMFGESKANQQTDNKELKKKSSRDWLLLSAGAAASVAVGLVGLAAYRLKFT